MVSCIAFMVATLYKKGADIMIQNIVVQWGVTFGTALAISISFNKNQSVLWAIVHGFFSWFYVIYHVIWGS